MAFSKANQFPTVVFLQSQWTKALSHPARIYLLLYLLNHGRTSFQDLARVIPLSKSTISQHLLKLRSMELIMAEEKYPHTYYILNRKNCENLVKHLEELNEKFKFHI